MAELVKGDQLETDLGAGGTADGTSVGAFKLGGGRADHVLLVMVIGVVAEVEDERKDFAALQDLDGGRSDLTAAAMRQ